MKLEGFNLITGIQQDNNWQPTANSIAQFIVIGVFEKAKISIKNALRQQQKPINKVTIKRDFELKPLVCDGNPTLQISVNSPMTSKQRVMDFYDSASGPDNLIGMSVRCKDTKGVIESVVGTLGKLREALLDWKPTDYDPNILTSSPDDDLVLGVKTYKGKIYHYPIRVLDVIVEMGGLAALGLSKKEINQVSYAVKIPPHDRLPLINIVRTELVNFCRTRYPAIEIRKSLGKIIKFV
jgi:hypothetical protein